MGRRVFHEAGENTDNNEENGCDHQEVCHGVVPLSFRDYALILRLSSEEIGFQNRFATSQLGFFLEKAIWIDWVENSDSKHSKNGKP